MVETIRYIRYKSPIRGLSPPPASGRKKFDGKPYFFYDNFDSQKKAKNCCEKLRQEGFYARHSQHINPFTDKVTWVVWRR